MSRTFFFQPGEIRVPMVCVACGVPIAMPTGDSRPEASLTVSGSTSTVNGTQRTTTTLSASFPLCSACADARARANARGSAREKDYPNVWAVRSVFLLSAVALVVFIFSVPRGGAQGGPLPGWALGVTLVAFVSARIWRSAMRERFDRANPVNENDARRLALIGEAGRIDTFGPSITFNNDTFAQAFDLANPGIETAFWQAQVGG
jgi:hypothetical protein